MAFNLVNKSVRHLSCWLLVLFAVSLIISPSIHASTLQDVKKTSVVTGLQSPGASSDKALQLDDKENAWLQSNKKVIVGISQYPPLTYLDDSGSHVGISADYLKLISDRTGLIFEVKGLVWPELMKQAKSREIDLFSGLKNPDRDKFLNFTAPYIQVSYVVINQLKAPFLSDFSFYNGKSVAVVKDWTIHKLMKIAFPEVKIVPFDNVPQALTAVSSGHVSAYVGDLLTASFQIQKNVLTNLKVAATAPFQNDFVRFAVREDWPELVSILDKAIRSMSREEHDTILRKWLYLTFEKGVDQSLAWKWAGGVAVFFSLIVVGGVILNRQLKRLVEVRTLELQESKEELVKHQNQLEHLVDDRTRQLKEAQTELVQGERLATLGSLTATVSHELRNPLGTIQTALFTIEDSLERNDSSQVARTLALADRSIVRCVAIIEELNNYARVKNLDISETSVDDWLRATFKEQSIPEEITCELDLSSGVRASFDHEKLRQVLVNLIANAVHALQDKQSNRKHLSVSTHLLDDKYEIRLSDNGIGMTSETKEKVFEPLFSTKGFGVGLGMVIVKNIVDQHHGEINIESKEGEGTTVTLRLPINFSGKRKN